MAYLNGRNRFTVSEPELFPLLDALSLSADVAAGKAHSTTSVPYAVAVAYRSPTRHRARIASRRSMRRSSRACRRIVYSKHVVGANKEGWMQQRGRLKHSPIPHPQDPCELATSGTRQPHDPWALKPGIAYHPAVELYRTMASQGGTGRSYDKGQQHTLKQLTRRQTVALASYFVTAMRLARGLQSTPSPASPCDHPRRSSLARGKDPG